MAAQPQAFPKAIADLHERLGRTRFPDQAPGEPWAYGTDVGYLQQLVEYWRSAFDWRAEEVRLSGFPQCTVALCGGHRALALCYHWRAIGGRRLASGRLKAREEHPLT